MNIYTHLSIYIYHKYISLHTYIQNIFTNQFVCVRICLYLHEYIYIYANMQILCIYKYMSIFIRIRVKYTYMDACKPSSTEFGINTRKLKVRNMSSSVNISCCLFGSIYSRCFWHLFTSERCLKLLGCAMKLYRSILDFTHYNAVTRCYMAFKHDMRDMRWKQPVPPFFIFFSTCKPLWLSVGHPPALGSGYRVPRHHRSRLAQISVLPITAWSNAWPQRLLSWT